MTENVLADVLKTAVPAVHQSKWCDGCEAHPIVGICYKCTECESFDFCPSCKDTISHEHSFLEINFAPIKVNVFRYSQNLDDPTLLYWRPWGIEEEWPFIYFLKLLEGKVIANTDFG